MAVRNYMFKKIIKASIFIIILGGIFSGCATVQTGKRYENSSLGKLQQGLDKIFDDKDFSNAIWGVEVKSADKNTILFQKNAEINLAPASNMKLYTTAATIHHLGSDYRYTTQIFGNMDIDTDGVMKGDILIKGSGDPTISGRYTKGTITTAKIIQNWVDSLKAKGIKTIKGNIIGDGSVFSGPPINYSWTWGYTPSAFSAEISGLSFNDNSFDLYFLPGAKTGEPAKTWLGLPTGFLQINSQVTTTDKDSRTNINIDRDWNTNQVFATGQIALNRDTEREWGSVHNPPLYLATVLYETLQKNGITVEGQPKNIDEYAPEEKSTAYTKNHDILMSYQSPPLSAILRILNKYSQNFFAEQLLRTLGKEVKGEGSTRKGIEAVKEFIEKAGVNTDQFQMVDGCGLAHTDMVQPHQTVQLLQYMMKDKNFKAYYDSLPIAGVDGTISSRMKNTPAEGKVHAKTGYIGNVRCLSGYLTTRDNETLVFSFMANNYTASTKKAEDIQDKACIQLVNFSRSK